jgi:hypothetical protein
MSINTVLHGSGNDRYYGRPGRYGFAGATNAEEDEKVGDDNQVEDENEVMKMEKKMRTNRFTAQCVLTLVTMQPNATWKTRLNLHDIFDAPIVTDMTTQHMNVQVLKWISSTRATPQCATKPQDFPEAGGMFLMLQSGVKTCN